MCNKYSIVCLVLSIVVEFFSRHESWIISSDLFCLSLESLKGVENHKTNTINESWFMLSVFQALASNSLVEAECWFLELIPNDRSSAALERLGGKVSSEISCCARRWLLTMLWSSADSVAALPCLANWLPRLETVHCIWPCFTSTLSEVTAAQLAMWSSILVTSESKVASPAGCSEAVNKACIKLEENS